MNSLSVKRLVEGSLVNRVLETVKSGCLSFSDVICAMSQHYLSIFRKRLRI